MKDIKNLLCITSILDNNSINKNLLFKIRSNYILARICNHLNVHKKLEILHYNKCLQSTLDIKLIDYMNYSDSLRDIVILIEKNNKPILKFINFDKNKEFCFKLFINNENIALNSNTDYIKLKKTEKIRIIIGKNINSLKYLFRNLIYFNYINFIEFSKKCIFDMSFMFCDCSSLEFINLENIITNNVKNMEYMFSGCTSLKEINLSNFNTNKVNNMSHMFYKCISLQKINISNFNTENVKYMNNMFSECSALKQINISNFNIDKAENMNGMFSKCSSLKEINISNFRTNNVQYMNKMFFGCSK